MTASKIAAADASDANRQRRAHKKSRRGCSSCKLRRVKCDERRPVCRKCRDYGVACTYDGKISAVSIAGESSFSLNEPSASSEEAPISAKVNTRDQSLDVARIEKLPRSRCLSESSTVLTQFSGLPSPPDSDGENSNYAFGRSELEIFQRFNARTVLSVGSSQTAQIYQREIFQLACSYPFLEHIVIALTLLHDRHLAGTDAISHKTLSHWYHGTAKFKEVLMQPIKDESRDALWASAALMGTIQFATFEARTPEEAWPLKSCGTTDLDWLKMSEGKKAVFTIADPTRSDSVFCKMSTGHQKLWRPLLETEDCSNTDAVEMTRDFIDMFGLGPTSMSGDSPYYKAAMALARLLHVKCDRNNVVEFFGFIVNINPELKRLLDQRDAKALLLVVHWYAKLYRAQWWLHRRGMIEGRAICMYLDKHHGNDAKLQRLLQWPKAELGLDASPVESGTSSGCSSSQAATVLCVM